MNTADIRITNQERQTVYDCLVEMNRNVRVTAMPISYIAKKCSMKSYRVAAIIKEFTTAGCVLTLTIMPAQRKPAYYYFVAGPMPEQSEETGDSSETQDGLREAKDLV